MVNEPIGIGDRFQQETKYHRKKMVGGFLDWRNTPEEFKEYPGDIQRFSLRNASKDGGGPLWEVMARRRSVRDFLPEAISFEELSQLIGRLKELRESHTAFGFGLPPQRGRYTQLRHM